MPVYNGEKYLRESIDSILAQTFTDFEFIIIDDGSTDNSYDIAAAYSDPRIHLVSQSRNQGLVAALNKGIELACGAYIARMDADDISLPERLARQVEFMDDNLAVGICGTWMQTFSGSKFETWFAPLSHDRIVARLLFQSALFHPTVIIRKALINAHLLQYMGEFEYAEDYDLWSRSALYCRLANIGEVLLHYRIHENSIGSLLPDSKQQSADLVRLRWLQDLGLCPTAKELFLHRQLSLGQVGLADPLAFLEHSHGWFLKIIATNTVSKKFLEPELSEEIAERWFLICNRLTFIGASVIRYYFRSPLRRHYKGKKRSEFALLVKGLLRWSGR